MDHIIPALANLAIPIDTLRPTERNPRRGDVSAIAASLTEFGQHRPIVSTADGEIIVGNHTWMAAKELGWTHVAAVATDDDPARAKARLLADNKTSERGRSDNAEVAILLAEINSEADELLAATGYEPGEIDALLRLAQPQNVTPVCYDDEVDEEPIRPSDLPPVALPGTAGGRPPGVAPPPVGIDARSDRDSVSDPVLDRGLARKTSRSGASKKNPRLGEREKNGAPHPIPGEYQLEIGDCREVMEDLLDDDSIDAVITDPGVGSLTDEDGWWRQVPGVGFWLEIERVMKPGAHILVFAGRKTWHRVAYCMEEAGLEMRDTLMWLYGTGMPMALDMGQAVNRKLGGEREPYFRRVGGMTDEERLRFVTDNSNPFYGYGTELKPTWEPILMFRKPLGGTNAENIMAYGTGSLNIDAARTGDEAREAIATWIPENQGEAHGLGLDKKRLTVGETTLGRWPPNVVMSHDHDESAPCESPCPVADFIEAHGEKPARYLYCPKASKREKNEGVPMENDHKAVKPLELCRWLVRLALPTAVGDGSNERAAIDQTGSGIVLDPFCGTGSVGIAANEEGFGFVGIDQDSHTINDLASHRLAHRRD